MTAENRKTTIIKSRNRKISKFTTFEITMKIATLFFPLNFHINFSPTINLKYKFLVYLSILANNY